MTLAAKKNSSKVVVKKSQEVKIAVSVTSSTDSAHSTPISVGAKIPAVTFITRTRIESIDQNPFDWKDLTTSDLFAGKRIVLFSLPGAFTPTCSSTHLPGYEKAYEEMKSLGVDEVYCLSVNDAFVMRQWGLSQGLSEVKLLPDGAALFTRGMGMSATWTTNRGFGERSWRYSAVIDDCKIEKLNVEPDFIQDSDPDPFLVSDAGTMLEYLKSV
ncbi:hypothetical protein TrLO_g6468 [Triparma laevis f. longispina]|uniref:Thioredoxin domain-containing protein n=1 Tax=Triparma laevis f. longispina TaxID=1714387 RepID=A0A9W7CGM1_9STRA|nr:hypothetical protein TrLO_g6468 [Triparma laevis f. longispina]